MSVLPSTVSGMELWAQEWRNSLFLQYLSIHLTCRTIAMDVDQNFLYSTPSTSRRGDSSQRVTNSSVMGFPTLQARPSPPRICDGKKIYTGCAVHRGKGKLKGKPLKDKGYLKGDLLIRYLWTQGMDSIHDMRVLNNDAASYQSKSPEK